MWSPRVLNNLYGLALTLGIVVIGVHSCDDYIAKTNTTVQVTIKQQPTPSPAVQPVKSKPLFGSFDFKPCDVMVAVNGKPTPKKAVSAKKKTASFSKTKPPHHKSFVPHRHKSKAPTHYHGKTHAHGHGHHAPQKIPAHGAPPHLTGPPVGCR